MTKLTPVKSTFFVLKSSPEAFILPLYFIKSSTLGGGRIPPPRHSPTRELSSLVNLCLHIVLYLATPLPSADNLNNF